MASSGTYSFSLSNASIATAAYSRLQIRRSALLAEHMADAFNEFNLMMASLDNTQVNLWKVDLVSVPLAAGQATYDVDPSTIQILDAYISFNGAPLSNRLIFPISRTEYASYSNPTAQGVPSVFWYDRLINPKITLWLVPDQDNTYTLNYYRCVQIQDVNLPSGETPDIPLRWYDAIVAGLAHRLARIWKPELEAARKADSDDAWSKAATQDVENVDMTVAPMLGGYYR